MVVLSHSPMRSLAAEYAGKRVMVLGSSAKKIAEEDLGLGETVECLSVERPRRTASSVVLRAVDGALACHCFSFLGDSRG